MQYNIFQALFMSFYSKSLYRDVAKNWGGVAFVYLLMLVSLSWIYTTYFIQQELNVTYHNNATTFTQQIPTLTLKNGILSTPENRPYIINGPETNTPIAVIDTSGKYKSLDAANTDMLITQTNIISQTKPNEIKINTFPAHFNAVINPQLINSYIAKFIGYSWIFIFITGVLITFILRILQALIYSIIGKIFNAATSARLSYGAIMQIMLVAITPSIVVGSFIQAFMVRVPYFFLYSYLLAMLYLLYGIIANKN